MTSSPSNHSIADAIASRSLAHPLRATYRLQFNHTFTFGDAARIVPYLADLGISHVYASPLFAAAPGSMHGYDVVDYGRINPEIGSDEEFDRFVDVLHAHDLRLIVDFVPNHMGIEGGQNSWWQDVLEHGEWSPFAEYFDIDWSPLKRELHGKVLVPFLGGQYGDVLEAGELKLVYHDGSLTINYWDTPLPVSPHTWPNVLGAALQMLGSVGDTDNIDRLELESVIHACEGLADDFSERTLEIVEARRRESLVIKHRLASLIERSSEVARATDAAIAEMNGTPGDAASFDALDRLLGLQHYRLAFWRVASEEINYRRFFAINSLAAIRQEEPAVFAATHELLLQLCCEGKIDGVRIDHPDGLWDPAGYFRQLQHAFVRGLVGSDAGDAEISAGLDRIGEESGIWPLYVVGEKILEHGEQLPADWPIAGTVGYEFAQAATGLFVDPAARVMFDRIFGRFTGDKIRFPELVYEMKQRMMREAFASEINVLTSLLNRISEQDRHSRDFTLNSLRQVLREVIAGFAVYRTYTTCNDGDVSEVDRRHIESAIAVARKRNSVIDPSVFDFANSVLQLQSRADQPRLFDRNCHFAMKVQQLTGPVMAKALEDTAFYRFNRLVSLNEVGGDPGKFGTSVEEFHRQNRTRLKSWPQSLLASSTHDTKRSEDVRARINVLSEIPTEWRAALNRWTRLNRKLKQLNDGALAPHRADDYVIYQTLIGTWPVDGLNAASRKSYQQRLSEYIVKVAREASRFTNWVNPDLAYEDALTRFVGGLLDQRRSRVFIKDFETFLGTILDAGLANALSQQLFKLSSPGVPDIYQGTELWDDSLVDPDNRRAVDFDLRSTGKNIDDDQYSGRAKLELTRSVLSARRERPDVFSRGEYIALSATGPESDSVVAFARAHEGDVAISVGSRLIQRSGTIFGNTEFWNGTVVELPESLSAPGANAGGVAPFESSSLELTRLFAKAPVAFLKSW